MPDHVPPTTQMTEMRTLRALLQVENAEDAVGVLIQLVQSLGGRTIPARLDHEWAFGAPFQLGDGEALQLVAAPESTARTRLATIFPRAVDDARVAVARLERSGISGEHALTDPLTGLRSAYEFGRRLLRAHGGDSVVVMNIDGLSQVNEDEGRE